MTQPTIEQMIAFLDDTMMQVEDDTPPMRYLQAIRAALTEKVLPEGTVAEHKKLVAAQSKLSCLEATGVDDCDGYDEAMDKYSVLNAE